MTRLCALLLRTACIVLALTATVAAQDYPTRPVRILVPFPPGGINDLVARLLATQLSERLGKQFIVENKTGAGGAVAGELVAGAPKDGHTLLIVSIAIAINPWMQKLPYDTIKAFAPVAIVATSPTVAVVNADLPAKSMQEFVALAKQKPGELKYASSGVGTSMHLGGELFKLTAGVDLLHVPFRGAGPAMIDVIGGHSQASFASIPSVIGHVRSGKLRALGIGALERNPALPDLPTMTEGGVAGYQAANWIGIVAPAGTPAPVVALLHKEISAIQDSAELRKRFASEGADVVQMSAAEFGAFIASEHAKWGRVIQEAKIKPE
ncbi:MAG: tripartite tricarboxylate transporter substrate binding protein [Xanthobacteraceae bacterium]|jgi:tripartite-type tricarboxylate transporter receptor subunit TctC